MEFTSLHNLAIPKSRRDDILADDFSEMQLRPVGPVFLGVESLKTAQESNSLFEKADNQCRPY